MSDFARLHEEQMIKVKKRNEPSEEDLDLLCRLMEEFERDSSDPHKGSQLKKAALSTVQYFNRFPALSRHDHMLRLYVIVGRYSANLGAHGIFDQCESKKFFCESFKFHLLWAESHAKQGHAQRFREILELAHKRVKTVGDSTIDMEFRKIAEKYLINAEIFPPLTESDIPANKLRKNRRISQVALIQDEALKCKDNKLLGSIGKGKLAVKLEFIDKVDYLPVSFEERTNAVYEDNLEVVEMDISCYQPATDDLPINQEKMCLPPLAELSENSSTVEKRRLIYSPQQPPKQSRLISPARDLPQTSSPVSFRENEYHKAAAIFSETVTLGNSEPQDMTMPVVQKPAEAFEVFEDPESSMAVPPVFAVPKERRPLAEIHPERISPVAPSKDIFGLDISKIEKDHYHNPHFYDDDPTIDDRRVSLQYQSKSGGIVTSTPAPNAIVTNKITDNDFFSTSIDDPIVPITQREEEFGFFKKRKSMKPDKITPQNENSTLSSAMERMFVETTEHENILEKTGVDRPVEEITGNINPWDSSIRQKIIKKSKTPLNQHEYQTVSPRISRNKDLVLSGMKFHVIDLVGEGGFAKVFKCLDEESGKAVALKYEVPSCAWEVYICNEVGSRLQQIVTPSAKRTAKCVMEITDAFIYTNSSIIINDFLDYAIHIATILRDVHACRIIHGDVKPDNIMLLRQLDENWDIEEIFTTPLIKFIDWGRAIDMSALPPNTRFTGRAGTDKFDCPEMMSGNPWNYHTDYFGFVATIRLGCRDVLTEIFDNLLNIPPNQPLPDWNVLIKRMTDVFRNQYSPIEWRTAVRLFNQNLAN